MSSVSDEEDLECPLCMEEIDITDKYFKPCPCGYQICRFCWYHIKEDLNGLCPACRRPYSDDSVEFTPVSVEEVARIKAAKKKKERERREQDIAARKQLANVRVVQKNLVYVLGLPQKLQNEEVLRSHDYFGQFGKITKIVVNRKVMQLQLQQIQQQNPHVSSAATTSNINNNGIYVTYARKEDATHAIDAVDGSICEGRVIRATYGTTKYCSYFLKNQPCQNVGCQFLHEPGEEADTYVKEELSAVGRDQRTTQRAIAFPTTRRDEKDEPGLPPTANWAKSGSASQASSKQFPVSGSQQPLSLQAQQGQDSHSSGADMVDDADNTDHRVPINISDPKQYPALEVDRPLSRNGPQDPASASRRRKERFVVDSPPATSGGVPTNSPAVAPSSAGQNANGASSSRNQAHSNASQLRDGSAFEQLQSANGSSPTTDNPYSPSARASTNDESAAGQGSVPHHNPSQPDYEILGSKALSGEPVESMTRALGNQASERLSLSEIVNDPYVLEQYLAEVGIRLVPRYTGVFDPFREDPLAVPSLLMQTMQQPPAGASNAGMYAQGSLGGSGGKVADPALSAQAAQQAHARQASAAAAAAAADAVASRKSRFERMFDGDSGLQMHDPTGVTAGNVDGAQDPLRALFPSAATVPFGAHPSQQQDDLARRADFGSAGMSQASAAAAAQVAAAAQAAAAQAAAARMFSPLANQAQPSFAGPGVRSVQQQRAGMTMPPQVSGPFVPGMSGAPLSIRQQELLQQAQAQQQHQQLNMLNRLKPQRQQRHQPLNSLAQSQQGQQQAAPTLGGGNISGFDGIYNPQLQLEQLRELQMRSQQQQQQQQQQQLKSIGQSSMSGNNGTPNTSFTRYKSADGKMMDDIYDANPASATVLWPNPTFHRLGRHSHTSQQNSFVSTNGSGSSVYTTAASSFYVPETSTSMLSEHASDHVGSFTGTNAIVSELYGLRDGRHHGIFHPVDSLSHIPLIHATDNDGRDGRDHDGGGGVNTGQWPLPSLLADDQFPPLSAGGDALKPKSGLRSVNPQQQRQVQPHGVSKAASELRLEPIKKPTKAVGTVLAAAMVSDGAAISRVGDGLTVSTAATTDNGDSATSVKDTSSVAVDVALAASTPIMTTTTAVMTVAATATTTSQSPAVQVRRVLTIKPAAAKSTASSTMPVQSSSHSLDLPASLSTSSSSLSGVHGDTPIVSSSAATSSTTSATPLSATNGSIASKSGQTPSKLTRRERKALAKSSAVSASTITPVTTPPIAPDTAIKPQPSAVTTRASKSGASAHVSKDVVNVNTTSSPVSSTRVSASTMATSATPVRGVAKTSVVAHVSTVENRTSSMPSDATSAAAVVDTARVMSDRIVPEQIEPILSRKRRKTKAQKQAVAAAAVVLHSDDADAVINPSSSDVSEAVVKADTLSDLVATHEVAHPRGPDAAVSVHASASSAAGKGKANLSTARGDRSTNTKKSPKKSPSKSPSKSPAKVSLKSTKKVKASTSEAIVAEFRSKAASSVGLLATESSSLTTAVTAAAAAVTAAAKVHIDSDSRDALTQAAQNLATTTTMLTQSLETQMKRIQTIRNFTKRIFLTGRDAAQRTPSWYDEMRRASQTAQQLIGTSLGEIIGASDFDPAVISRWSFEDWTLKYNTLDYVLESVRESIRAVHAELVDKFDSGFMTELADKTMSLAFKATSTDGLLHSEVISVIREIQEQTSEQQRLAEQHLRLHHDRAGSVSGSVSGSGSDDEKDAQMILNSCHSGDVSTFDVFKAALQFPNKLPVPAPEFAEYILGQCAEICEDKNNVFGDWAASVYGVDSAGTVPADLTTDADIKPAAIHGTENASSSDQESMSAAKSVAATSSELLHTLGLVREMLMKSRAMAASMDTTSLASAAAAFAVAASAAKDEQSDLNMADMAHLNTNHGFMGAMQDSAALTKSVRAQDASGVGMGSASVDRKPAQPIHNMRDVHGITHLPIRTGPFAGAINAWMSRRYDIAERERRRWRYPALHYYSSRRLRPRRYMYQNRHPVDEDDVEWYGDDHISNGLHDHASRHRSLSRQGRSRQRRTSRHRNQDVDDYFGDSYDNYDFVDEHGRAVANIGEMHHGRLHHHQLPDPRPHACRRRRRLPAHERGVDDHHRHRDHGDADTDADADDDHVHEHDQISPFQALIDEPTPELAANMFLDILRSSFRDAEEMVSVFMTSDRVIPISASPTDRSEVEAQALYVSRMLLAEHNGAGNPVQEYVRSLFRHKRLSFLKRLGVDVDHNGRDDGMELGIELDHDDISLLMCHPDGRGGGGDTSAVTVPDRSVANGSASSSDEECRYDLASAASAVIAAAAAASATVHTGPSRHTRAHPSNPDSHRYEQDQSDSNHPHQQQPMRHPRRSKTPKRSKRQRSGARWAQTPCLLEPGPEGTETITKPQNVTTTPCAATTTNTSMATESEIASLGEHIKNLQMNLILSREFENQLHTQLAQTVCQNVGARGTISRLLGISLDAYAKHVFYESDAVSSDATDSDAGSIFDGVHSGSTGCEMEFGFGGVLGPLSLSTAVDEHVDAPGRRCVSRVPQTYLHYYDDDDDNDDDCVVDHGGQANCSDVCPSTCFNHDDGDGDDAWTDTDVE